MNFIDELKLHAKVLRTAVECRLGELTFISRLFSSGFDAYDTTSTDRQVKASAHFTKAKAATLRFGSAPDGITDNNGKMNRK